MTNGFRFFNAWAPHIKTMLMGIVFGVGCSGVQALTLSDYSQHTPGSGSGEIRITDLDYSITQIGVQINVPNSQVNFELIRDAQDIVVAVTDPYPRTNYTLMTVSLVSNKALISRSYVIKGGDGTNTTPPTLKQPPIELDNTAIKPSNEPVPDNALTIDITESASMRTVRDAVNVIVQGSNVSLLELPGDEAVLDILIAPDAKITRLEDLYALSNYQVGEVIVDTAQGIVRVRPHSPHQRLYLDEDPEQILSSAPGQPSNKQAITQTVREIVQALASEQGMTLLELPGDEQRLNTVITTSAPITAFDGLYALPNHPVRQIVLDQANQTIRVL